MTNSPQSSTNNRQLITLVQNMAAEQATHAAMERSPTVGTYRAAQETLMNTVKAIGRDGDLPTILTAEKSILTNELRFYGNSAGHKSSLKAALQDLVQAEKHLSIVADKDRYASHNELFQRPKNRRGGLPYDEARQFFSAHNTRLLNQDRARMSETEKRTVKARRANIRKAEQAYIALQQKALGLENDKDKTRDRGISR